MEFQFISAKSNALLAFHMCSNDSERGTNRSNKGRKEAGPSVWLFSNILVRSKLSMTSGLPEKSAALTGNQ